MTITGNPLSTGARPADHLTSDAADCPGGSAGAGAGAGAVAHPPVENTLGWALGTALRAYVRTAASALADLPGGPRGYQLLSAASADLACSQQALGQLVGVDRSVMTYLVDDLAAAGLVQRQPDPTDRRARRVVLTPEGRSRLTLLDERLALVDEHALRALSPDERDMFRAMLQRVAVTAADAADAADAEVCDLLTDPATPPA